MLPDMLEHFDGTESLCVSFERKNKPPLFTQEKSVLLNRMDEITATFKETLKVDTTLYKDNKTGLYKVLVTSSEWGCLKLFLGKNGQVVCAPTQTRSGWHEF